MWCCYSVSWRWWQRWLGLSWCVGWFSSRPLCQDSSSFRRNPRVLLFCQRSGALKRKCRFKYHPEEMEYCRRAWHCVCNKKGGTGAGPRCWGDCRYLYWRLATRVDRFCWWTQWAAHKSGTSQNQFGRCLKTWVTASGATRWATSGPKCVNSFGGSLEDSSWARQASRKSSGADRTTICKGWSQIGVRKVLQEACQSWFAQFLPHSCRPGFIRAG